MAKFYYVNELAHHGINGQKWGIRRYQNEDGSLTPEGRLRYRDEYNYRTEKTIEYRKQKDRRIAATSVAGITTTAAVAGLQFATGIMALSAFAIPAATIAAGAAFVASSAMKQRSNAKKANEAYDKLREDEVLGQEAARARINAKREQEKSDKK